MTRVIGFGLFNLVGARADGKLQLDIKEVKEILLNPVYDMTNNDFNKLQSVKIGDEVRLSDGWTYIICRK